MTAQMHLDLRPSLLADDAPTTCPHCHHRAAVHAGPGASAVEPGTCGEAPCHCPGWHPLREPAACAGCHIGDVDLFIVQGFAAWYCAACLTGTYHVPKAAFRRSHTSAHRPAPRDLILAVCWGACRCPDAWRRSGSVRGDCPVHGAGPHTEGVADA